MGKYTDDDLQEFLDNAPPEKKIILPHEVKEDPATQEFIQKVNENVAKDESFGNSDLIE